MLCSGLADEARFPNIVSERLLAIDVLAMGQSKVSGQSVSVLCRGDHHGVKVIGPIEYPPKVRHCPGLWITLRRRIQGKLVHIAEDSDILVQRRSFGGRAAARHEGKFVQTGIATAAT